jgi:hypothetical protein
MALYFFLDRTFVFEATKIAGWLGAGVMFTI